MLPNANKVYLALLAHPMVCSYPRYLMHPPYSCFSPQIKLSYYPEVVPGGRSVIIALAGHPNPQFVTSAPLLLRTGGHRPQQQERATANHLSVLAQTPRAACFFSVPLLGLLKSCRYIREFSESSWDSDIEILSLVEFLLATLFPKPLPRLLFCVLTS